MQQLFCWVSILYTAVYFYVAREAHVASFTLCNQLLPLEYVRFESRLKIATHSVL